MKNAQNNTADNILQYIRTNKQARPADLSDSIGVSLQMIHRSLKDLLEQRMIKKTGSAPRVFYSLDKNQDEKSSHSVESEKTKVSKEQYEIKTTFKDNVYLDELWYLYPYSIAIFGKTKISQLIFHAKQTQDIALMKRAFTIIENRIHQYIDYIKPDAVAFIPPTVPRKKQIMKELKKFLSLHIPEIQIEKIKTGILVQQKTLKDLDDRVYNAKHTMVVTSKVNKPYKKLLLIDDFTGSGSTLNQVAKKCKEQGVAEEVIGLTLTGSINGFDVLREI
jgi:predicted amidophosphoribosyltransferase